MKVVAQSAENWQVELTVGPHDLLADEPESAGGDNAGPTPYGFLLSALAACKIITVQMYARRKEWPLTRVRASLTTHKVYARDVESSESAPGAKIDIIEVTLGFEGGLTEEQIQRLGQIAERCPVHRTLTSETIIRTTIANGEGAE